MVDIQTDGQTVQRQTDRQTQRDRNRDRKTDTERELFGVQNSSRFITISLRLVVVAVAVFSYYETMGVLDSTCRQQNCD